jgi:hypothetical protein
METTQAACSYRMREETMPIMYIRPARLSANIYSLYLPQPKEVIWKEHCIKV